MRKICRRMTKTAAALFLVFALALPVKAGILDYYLTPDGTDTASETSPDELLGDFIDNLPDEVRKRLPDSVTNDMTSEDAVSALSFKGIVSRILSSLSELLPKQLGTLSLVMCILILSALARTAASSLGGTRTSRLVDMTVAISAALVLAGVGSRMMEAAESFRELTCGIMNAVVPVLGVIYAASGNVTTASVQSGGMLLLVTLCQNLFSLVFLPAVKICLSLGIVGAVFGETELSRITGAVRSFVTWLILSVMTLFSFILGIQNTVAQSADNFGIRSLKFALGSLVPIIGGAVSDSLGTIGGSLGVLKSACGGIAIVIIITIVAPGILFVLSQKMLLFILKSAAGILGCGREEKLIGEIGLTASITLAFMIAMAFSFVYALTLFTSSALAIAS